VKIGIVLDALERFAPLPLQESYDNAGLQIGITEAEVSGVLLCLDVTEGVVDEALARDCNLIVSHHPLIFHKLAHVSDSTYVERCVMKAIKNDIAIASMHTNLDSARGGVNYKIAEKMGLGQITGIGDTKNVDGVDGASGVIGVLEKPMVADDFIAMLKHTFNVECVQANRPLRRQISKVALCGGAGSFLLDDAVRAGADAFVTGEMHYHEFFGHDGQLQIAVIGHYQSEQFTAEVLRSVIEPLGVRCCMSEINTNPIYYF
jgi:dinuclear metal center YbgI/SA1388 family protein